MRLSLLAGSGALVPAAVAAAQEAGHKIQVLSLTPARRPAWRQGDRRPMSAIRSASSGRSRSSARRISCMAGAISLSDKTREALAKFAAGGDRTGRQAAASMGDATLSHLAVSLERMTGAKVDRRPGASRPGCSRPRDASLAQRSTMPTASCSALCAACGARDRPARPRPGRGRHRPPADRRRGHRRHRCAARAASRDLRAAGLTGDGGSPLILAKAAKPGQPRFRRPPGDRPRHGRQRRRSRDCGRSPSRPARTLLIDRAADRRGGRCGGDQRRRPRLRDG